MFTTNLPVGGFAESAGTGRAAGVPEYFARFALAVVTSEALKPDPLDALLPELLGAPLADPAELELGVDPPLELLDEQAARANAPTTTTPSMDNFLNRCIVSNLSLSTVEHC
jgi:hypothetical protein